MIRAVHQTSLGPWVVGLCLLQLLFGAPASAEVDRIVFERSDLPTQLGDVALPPYEKLVGTVYFALEPGNPHNRAINDLLLAPRNERGLVEAEAEFMALVPKHAEDDRGVAFLEVSNRGGKASLRYFHNASGSTRNPATVDDLGDGLLMRMGLTVIWVGWQLDVPLGPDVLQLVAPPVSDRGRPVVGKVRADWVVDEAVDELELSHRNHRAYPPAIDLSGHRLTVRSGRNSRRNVVPASKWSFIELDNAAAGASAIRLDGGFEAGKIYELVYLSREPKVVGMGLAALRDFLSFAKHSEDSPFRVERGVGFGVSQTGRLLRTFLYQGFNADEQGRRVFDGLLIHTAGAGRGSFNHRFAQPSRDAHRYSAFFYPTDLFPFSGRQQTDALTGRSDGLLRVYQDQPELLPRIFYTNTGYEYWGRAAGLLHAEAVGQSNRSPSFRDIEPLPNERIYHLASAQHFVDRWPIPSSARLGTQGENRAPGPLAFGGNPVDLLVPLRALVVRLLEWVDGDREPPPSRFPKIAEGTLVPFEQYRLPDLGGVELPRSPHVAYRADYGPNWPIGIVDQQPPRLGRAFPALVPAVDSVGNERGGVTPVEVAVPVATFLPWSLRDGLANPREMVDFRGQTLPLRRSGPPTAQDGRPSIGQRYPGGASQYRQKVKAEIERQIAAGWMLEEDRDRVIARTEELWSWANQLAAAP